MNKLLIAILGLGITIGAPLLADEKSDNLIYDATRRRLAGDPDVKGGALEVEVKDGVVTLKGIVRTDQAKAKAEKLTLKVKGAKKVVNQLRVSPYGTDPPA